MLRRTALALATLAVLSGRAAAADDAPIQSEVYQAQGDVPDLTRRALTCIQKVVTPMKVDSSPIRSSDLAAGVVVANNVFTFAEGVYTQRLGRTVMTFEAKPGRFRITHDQVESPGGFGDVWMEHRSKELLAKVAEIDSQVAACVQRPPDNW